MTTIRDLLRAALLGVLTSVLVACGSGEDLAGSATAVATMSAPGPTLDPPATHPYTESAPVPGRYIVVFKRSVGNPAAEAANIMRGRGGQIHHTYSHAIKGFAASIPEAALEGIRRNPNVDYIEQDQRVSIRAEQSGATWGLDRIDQQGLPLNGRYRYDFTGAGVRAFIIDTGIFAHDDFGSRLNRGAGLDVVNDGHGTNDCDGHGTHVAGTVGGTIWGVAKSVTLVPVRVLDCTGSGYWSWVIAGINHVAASTWPLRVANMSLGGGKSSAVDQAVAGAVNAGVTMVVAAGNSRGDACRYSPAREPSAITVGATTSSDWRASYSNYGSCVDIFAPGSSITSAWNTSASATNTISGTSMAAPHVAGVAALVLEANAGATPAVVASLIVANATADRLNSIGRDSPNLLLYSLIGAGGGGGGGGGGGDPGATTTVAIASIIGSLRQQGKAWRAYATVTIGDANNGFAPVANATVQGAFAPGGSSSCVTGGDGSCTLSSDRISDGTTTFTVSDVSGTGLTYQSSANSVDSVVLTP